MKSTSYDEREDTVRGCVNSVDRGTIGTEPRGFENDDGHQRGGKHRPP